MAEKTKRILLVLHHNTFREALAIFVRRSEEVNDPGFEDTIK